MELCLAMGSCRLFSPLIRLPETYPLLALASEHELGNDVHPVHPVLACGIFIASYLAKIWPSSYFPHTFFFCRNPFCPRQGTYSMVFEVSHACVCCCIHGLDYLYLGQLQSVTEPSGPFISSIHLTLSKGWMHRHWASGRLASSPGAVYGTIMQRLS